MKAPQAAGSIHGDFETYFIKAEVRNFRSRSPPHLNQVMAYNDLKELGSEVAVKAAGKYRMEGKAYDVEDGDIMVIKHNAGGAKKK